MSATDIICVSLVVGYGLWLAWRLGARQGRRDTRAARADGDAFSEPGVAVEVDCRSCGQFNRVPSHRLRDRPKCGRCKARLMPGKRFVLCRVSPLEGMIRVELNALWKDEDRLWSCVADHVAIQSKVRAEERGEQPRVVN